MKYQINYIIALIKSIFNVFRQHIIELGENPICSFLYGNETPGIIEETRENLNDEFLSLQRKVLYFQNKMRSLVKDFI